MATKAEIRASAKSRCFRACTDCTSADECDPDENWIEEARAALETNEIKSKSKRLQPIAIGLAAARARGRNGGRKPKMTPAKLRLAQAAVGKRGTVVSDLCEELGISSQTITGTSPLRAAYGSKERK